MKKALLLIIIISTSLFSAKSFAGWVTIQTKIQYINTYLDRDHILIVPENLNFELPQSCTDKVIAIDPSTTEERKNRALSALLAAQARGAYVKLTVYDNACVPWTSGDTQYLKLIKVTSLQN